MEGIKLPEHVHAVKAGSGKTYYYYQYRRGCDDEGPRSRIPHEPDTPQFWTEYKKMNGDEDADKGTVNGLLAEYRQSPEYQQLSDATHRDYNRYLLVIAERFGKFSPVLIHRKHIYAFRDSFADRPSTANHAVAVLKTVFEWAAERGEIEINPAQGVKRLKVESDGAEPWPQWAVDFAITKARPEFATFVALALYTGQRTKDVVAMTLRHIDRSDARRWRIAVKQSKTGKELLIPVHKRLRPVLEQAMKRGWFSLVPRPNGEPMEAEQFRAMFYRELKKPNMVALAAEAVRPHGLRKSAAVALRETGQSDALISSITGMSKSMVEHYTKSVDQARMAEEAMTAWEASDRTGDEQDM